MKFRTEPNLDNLELHEIDIDTVEANGALQEIRFKDKYGNVIRVLTKYNQELEVQVEGTQNDD